MDPKTIARAAAVILLGGAVLACAVELAQRDKVATLDPPRRATTHRIRLPMNSHAARPLAPKQRTTPPARRLGHRTARGFLRGRPRTWITQSSYFPRHQMRRQAVPKIHRGRVQSTCNPTSARQARIRRALSHGGHGSH